MKLDKIKQNKTPLPKRLTNEEIAGAKENVLRVRNQPNLDPECTVERCSELATNASSSVFGCDARDEFIRAKTTSRS